MTLDDLIALGARDLKDILENGHPIDPSELADRQLNGVSLAPSWVRHTVAWTKFRKTFKTTEDGSLRGWNVACEQTPLDQPWVHRQRRGTAITYGHYRVIEGPHASLPGGMGLVIDYTIGGNRLGDPMSLVRDPLVAVEPGRTDLLLGLSMAAVAGKHLSLPLTWFVLAGGEPLDHNAWPPRSL